MRDRKLVKSRQRSLSSRFSLSRRERPLLAEQGKLEVLWRWGGLMVSVLVYGLSGPPGTSCSWAKHLTPIVPLSTQVYKWVPANLKPGVTL